MKDLIDIRSAVIQFNSSLELHERLIITCSFISTCIHFGQKRLPDNSLHWQSLDS